MNHLLDSLTTIIWRASWQAIVLALLIAIVVQCTGNRLAARWRFMLWSLVLARLLILVTPGTVWSPYNFLAAAPNVISAGRLVSSAGPSVPHSSPAPNATSQEKIGFRSDLDAGVDPVSFLAAEQGSSSMKSDGPANSGDDILTPVKVATPQYLGTRRILSILWLGGFTFAAFQLLLSLITLRRRISSCRRVTDPALLRLVENSRTRLGLRCRPTLLVTPNPHSPCVVGTWKPCIILPESMVTEVPLAQLRHVVAHEMAHVARGDLWTNWLMISARLVHWFNPVAGWAVREMHAEREAACDQLALASLDARDRLTYPTTLVELAASLHPPALCPAFIPFFSSTHRLESRLNRLVQTPSSKLYKPSFAIGLWVLLAFLGLTDAKSAIQAQTVADSSTNTNAARTDAETKNGTYVVSGLCVSNEDNTPLSGIRVRLYRTEGRVAPPVEIAESVTDKNGRYEFPGLKSPRPENQLDRLEYNVLGISEKGLVGMNFMHMLERERVTTIHISQKTSTVEGRVSDSQGRPVADATVAPYFFHGQSLLNQVSTTTDAAGRFQLGNVGVFKWPDGSPLPMSFTVRHRDFPTTNFRTTSLPANIDVVLSGGCVITGKVIDTLTRKPYPKAEITARRLNEWSETFTASDILGGFRMVVPEGTYDFLVSAKDRVGVATARYECLAGEKVELPPFNLTAGGIIAGRVLNTATGQPVALADGEPVAIGFFGPSRPTTRVISPARMAVVDEAGRFEMRAAAGENFPYLVNTRGVRMAWDTQSQPPVIVKDGETTHYDMLITPERTPEEALRAARELVQTLPADSSERTGRILDEFRKLNHTVDETELWCLLMRELVTLGSKAVPQICGELDRATEDRLIRRLGFALRAIGDQRAVPALIRAIPRTLLPSSSDYGLIVADKELHEFMQQHDLDNRKGGTHFSFGRPVREVIGALHSITGQDRNDAELFSIHLSEDPRRQVLQRKIFERRAQAWQQWWEADARRLAQEKVFQKGEMLIEEQGIGGQASAAARPLGKDSRVVGEFIGAVLSPALEKNQYAWHFYDLDTGFQPKWPQHIAREDVVVDGKLSVNRPLDEWAIQNGIDLMCAIYRDEDGTETYVLRSFGLKVVEVDARDVRILDKIIAAGSLPTGRAVADLLMHFDLQAERFQPDANAAFLYTTREGNMGLIETTDRVTRAADVTGQLMTTPGVGFHQGVRFNLKAIIP